MSEPCVGTASEELVVPLDDGLLDDAVVVLQRVLLTTDATVVRLLEGCFGEAIEAADTEQFCTPVSPGDVELDPAEDETVLRRSVVLRGACTGRNYIYGESCAVLDRLDPRVRDGLLGNVAPIGHLLMHHRVETFREILAVGRQPARALASVFDIDPSADVLFRRYRILSGGRPVMLITEYLPAIPRAAG